MLIPCRSQTVMFRIVGDGLKADSVSPVHWLAHNMPIPPSWIFSNHLFVTIQEFPIKQTGDVRQ